MKIYCLCFILAVIVPLTKAYCYPYLSDSLIIKAERAIQQGSYDSAMIYCNMIILNRSQNEPGYVGKILILSKLQKYREALDVATEALKFHRNSSIIYFRRGEIFQNIGNVQSAIDDFTQAIQYNPKWSWPYCSRAALYMEKQQLDSAEADIKQSLAIDSTSGVSWAIYGGIHLNRKNYKQSSFSYSRAINLGFTTPAVYYDRGRVNYFLGKFQEAIDDFDVCLHTQKSHFMAYYYQGNSFLEIRNMAAAAEKFTEYLNIVPKVSEYQQGIDFAQKIVNQYGQK
jgi:tetratricopeptide (TPR) repeat protein